MIQSTPHSSAASGRRRLTLPVMGMLAGIVGGYLGYSHNASYDKLAYQRRVDMGMKEGTDDEASAALGGKDLPDGQNLSPDGQNLSPDGQNLSPEVLGQPNDANIAASGDKKTEEHELEKQSVFEDRKNPRSRQSAKRGNTLSRRQGDKAAASQRDDTTGVSSMKTSGDSDEPKTKDTLVTKPASGQADAIEFDETQKIMRRVDRRLKDIEDDVSFVNLIFPKYSKISQEHKKSVIIYGYRELLQGFMESWKGCLCRGVDSNSLDLDAPRDDHPSLRTQAILLGSILSVKAYQGYFTPIFYLLLCSLPDDMRHPDMPEMSENSVNDPEFHELWNIRAEILVMGHRLRSMPILSCMNAVPYQGKGGKTSYIPNEVEDMFQERLGDDTYYEFRTKVEEGMWYLVYDLLNENYVLKDDIFEKPAFVWLIKHMTDELKNVSLLTGIQSCASETRRASVSYSVVPLDKCKQAFELESSKKKVSPGTAFRSVLFGKTFYDRANVRDIWTKPVLDLFELTWESPMCPNAVNFANMASARYVIQEEPAINVLPNNEAVVPIVDATPPAQSRDAQRVPPQTTQAHKGSTPKSGPLRNLVTNIRNAISRNVEPDAESEDDANLDRTFAVSESYNELRATLCFGPPSTCDLDYVNCMREYLSAEIPEYDEFEGAWLWLTRFFQIAYVNPRGDILFLENMISVAKAIDEIITVVENLADHPTCDTAKIIATQTQQIHPQDRLKPLSKFVINQLSRAAIICSRVRNTHQVIWDIGIFLQRWKIISKGLKAASIDSLSELVVSLKKLPPHNFSGFTSNKELGTSLDSTSPGIMDRVSLTYFDKTEMAAVGAATRLFKMSSLPSSNYLPIIKSIFSTVINPSRDRRQLIVIDPDMDLDCYIRTYSQVKRRGLDDIADLDKLYDKVYIKEGKLRELYLKYEYIAVSAFEASLRMLNLTHNLNLSSKDKVSAPDLKPKDVVGAIAYEWNNLDEMGKISLWTSEKYNKFPECFGDIEELCLLAKLNRLLFVFAPSDAMHFRNLMRLLTLAPEGFVTDFAASLHSTDKGTSHFNKCLRKSVERVSTCYQRLERIYDDELKKAKEPAEQGVSRIAPISIQQGLRRLGLGYHCIADKDLSPECLGCIRQTSFIPLLALNWLKRPEFQSMFYKRAIRYRCAIAATKQIMATDASLAFKAIKEIRRGGNPTGFSPIRFELANWAIKGNTFWNNPAWNRRQYTDCNFDNTSFPLEEKKLTLMLPWTLLKGQWENLDHTGGDSSIFTDEEAKVIRPRFTGGRIEDSLERYSHDWKLAIADYFSEHLSICNKEQMLGLVTDISILLADFGQLSGFLRLVRGKRTRLFLEQQNVTLMRKFPDWMEKSVELSFHSSMILAVRTLLSERKRESLKVFDKFVQALLTLDDEFCTYQTFTTNLEESEPLHIRHMSRVIFSPKVAEFRAKFVEILIPMDERNYFINANNLSSKYMDLLDKGWKELSEMGAVCKDSDGNSLGGRFPDHVRPFNLEGLVVCPTDFLIDVLEVILEPVARSKQVVCQYLDWYLNNMVDAEDLLRREELEPFGSNRRYLDLRCHVGDSQKYTILRMYLRRWHPIFLDILDYLIARIDGMVPIKFMRERLEWFGSRDILPEDAKEKLRQEYMETLTDLPIVMDPLKQFSSQDQLIAPVVLTPYKGADFTGGWHKVDVRNQTLMGVIALMRLTGSIIVKD